MATLTRPTPPQRPQEDDGSVQALLHEIDAEVKAENFEKFLKQYGTHILAAVGAVVLGTAIFSTYSNYVVGEQRKETALLIATMDRDAATLKDDELRAVLESFARLGKDGHGEGIRLAAGVGEVNLLMQKDQKEAAIKRLDDMSKDQRLRPLYRDYMLLQRVRAEMDTGDAQKLSNDLQPLLAEGNPWRLSALQVAAMLDAKLGHVDQATAKLQRIIDAPDAPLTGREEASQLLRLYKAM